MDYKTYPAEKIIEWVEKLKAIQGHIKIDGFDTIAPDMMIIETMVFTGNDHDKRLDIYTAPLKIKSGDRTVFKMWGTALEKYRRGTWVLAFDKAASHIWRHYLETEKPLDKKIAEIERRTTEEGEMFIDETYPAKEIIKLIDTLLLVKGHHWQVAGAGLNDAPLWGCDCTDDGKSMTFDVPEDVYWWSVDRSGYSITDYRRHIKVKPAGSEKTHMVFYSEMGDRIGRYNRGPWIVRFADFVERMVQENKDKGAFDEVDF